MQAEHKYGSEIENPFELVTGCITSLLTKYIVDFDINVIRVASEALYNVLDCKEGKTILGEWLFYHDLKLQQDKFEIVSAASNTTYEHGLISKGYIFPFITSRKVRTDSNFTLKSNFVQLVDQNSLWCPENVTLHSTWITKLVCTILETFTDKCYLKSLIPICKAKVSGENIIVALKQIPN